VKIYRDPTEVPHGARKRAVTIGAFDGVHLGHQAVLRLVHELAQARDLSSTVLTFDRHPAEVVRPAPDGTLTRTPADNEARQYEVVRRGARVGV